MFQESLTMKTALYGNSYAEISIDIQVVGSHHENTDMRKYYNIHVITIIILACKAVKYNL